MVPGWAAGGGHSLHVVCDLTLASREHARFKQTDADVASFDGGFGSAFTLVVDGMRAGRITLGVPGAINVLDALPAAAIGLELGIAFRKFGCEVEVVSDGREALEMLARRGYDAVLMCDDDTVLSTPGIDRLRL